MVKYILKLLFYIYIRNPLPLKAEWVLSPPATVCMSVRPSLHPSVLASFSERYLQYFSIFSFKFVRDSLCHFEINCAKFDTVGHFCCLDEDHPLRSFYILSFCIAAYLSEGFLHSTPVLFNCNCVVQGNDFKSSLNEVVFLCWDQYSKPGISGTHSPADEILAHKPTGLSRSKLKNMLIAHDSTNLRSWEKNIRNNNNRFQEFLLCPLVAINTPTK